MGKKGGKGYSIILLVKDQIHLTSQEGRGSPEHKLYYKRLTIVIIMTIITGKAPI